MSIQNDSLPTSNIAKRFYNDNYIHKISSSKAPLLDVTALQFSLLDPEEMLRMKSEKITKSAVNCKGAPVAGSVNSSSMGPMDRNGKCDTCQLQPCECDGQFAAMDLGYPVYHAYYYDRIIKILKCVCPWCSRLLIDKRSAQYQLVISAEKDPKERLSLLEQASLRIQTCDLCPPKRSKRRKNVSNEAATAAVANESTQNEDETIATAAGMVGSNEDPEQRRKRLIESGCCGGVQFTYKRNVNDIWRKAKASDGEFVQGRTTYISPAEVYDILSRISDEDIAILGSHPVYAPPKRMLWTVLPVPPLNIRPVVVFNNGTRRRTENPFTKKLGDIQKVNNDLFKVRRKLIQSLRKNFDSSADAILAGLNVGQTVNDQNASDTFHSTEDNIENADLSEQKTALYAENEISKKPRSTLTAVLRSNRSHQKIIEKKQQAQLQLELEDNELIISTSNRSGDLSISDEEWLDYSRYDAAYHESTRWAVDYLQGLINSYLKEDSPPPTHHKKHPLRTHGNNRVSIRSRLKGKTAIVRGAGLAKRNDYSTRGVITPNPDIDIDELGMPECRARDVTVPEVVTEMNKMDMIRLILNGPKVYPGANLVNEETDLLDLCYKDRYEFAFHKLQVGMVVHRHILQGEWIPFNRQPSLHKFSIMAHRIRIIQGNTFEMHSNACKCYNADFDGDAMVEIRHIYVLHIPQTYGARVESARLLRLELQLQTPQSSTPIITPIQDTVTGAFHLTQNDIVMSEENFHKYAGKAVYVPLATIGITRPAMIVRSAESCSDTFHAFRTGKQLFSQLLPEGTQFVSEKADPNAFFYSSPISSDTKEFANTDEFQKYKESLFEDNDTNVTIVDSQLWKGTINSSIFSALIGWINHEFGCNCSVRFQSSSGVSINYWFSDYGFSCSPGDCTLPDFHKIRSLIKNGLKTICEHPLLSFNQENAKIARLATISEADDEEENENDFAAADPDADNEKKENDESVMLIDEDVVVEDFDNPPKQKSALSQINIQQRRDFMRNGNKTKIAQIQALERLREKTRTNICNQFASFVGSEAQKQVQTWNRLWQMIVSGGKGKLNNLNQILAMMGQQTDLSNQVAKQDRRVTAHFPRADTKIPERWLQYFSQDPLSSRGFVPNGFSGNGMTAWEFYCLAMSGRLGMVCSVMSTGETGYAHRRLIAAMANLAVYYDLSVRDSAGNLLQILYGNDGFDATWLKKFNLPLLTMDNKQLQKEFQITNDQFEKILWPAEKKRFDQYQNVAFGKKSELKRHLENEMIALTKYRDQIRESRLHYDCIKFDPQIIVPANPFALIQSAKRKFQNGKLVSKPDHPILTPSLVSYFVHGTVEHLYCYYRCFYNRLWDFEASIYSALSIKNVLINYRMTYVELEWILSTLVVRFRRALVDARELTGPLSGQMVGQMGTQNALDSHAGISEDSEEGSMNLMHEMINFAQKPKNPMMRIYPVSLQTLEQFMEKDTLEKFVFGSKQTLEQVQQLSSEAQSKIICEFIKDQLVHRVVNDVCVNNPRMIYEPSLLETQLKEDETWLKSHIALMTPYEIEQLRERSNCVIRLTVDAQKCTLLHLKPTDIVQSIRNQLDDEIIPENSTQLQKKVNNATFGLDEKEVAESLNYNVVYDSALIALCSPTITDKETRQEYWIIRLYISPYAKYYKTFTSKYKDENGAISEAMVKKAMYMLMSRIATRTVCGIEGIKSARVEEEMRKTVDSATGKIVSTTESLVITKGTAMLDTLALPFVDQSKSMTSYLIEIDEVWGVDTGANCLGRNLQKVLQARNGKIDNRHLQSVVKTMCHRGFFMPFRRQGINRVRDVGPMQRATYEETLEMFADAAASGEMEHFRDANSNTMFGKPTPHGTGATQVETIVDIGPEPDVIQSHMDFQRHRVIPVYNSLDRRVMLYNSGEQQIYQARDQLESKEFAVGSTANEVERIMHTETRYNMRCTTLSSQKKFVGSDQQVYEPEIEETAVNSNELLPSKEQISKDPLPATLSKNQKFKNLSAYGQQINLLRERARQQMKEKIALKQVLNDHTQAIANKKRKNTQNKSTNDKQETDEELALSTQAKRQKKNKIAATSQSDTSEENVSNYSSVTNCNATHVISIFSNMKRKLPTSCQIINKEIAHAIHVKGEAFTSQVFITNKRKKLLPRVVFGEL